MRQLPDLVVWCDPGVASGMAALSTDGVDCCQTVGVEAFGNTLDELLSFYRQASLSCAVGWESYLVTGARSADSTVALRVIGVAQWLAHRYSAEVLPEVPSSARTVVSNDLLKRLGWYTPGLDHANQAARHLAAWLAREHLLTPDQREAFTSSLAAGTPE